MNELINSTAELAPITQYLAGGLGVLMCLVAVAKCFSMDRRPSAAIAPLVMGAGLILGSLLLPRLMSAADKSDSHPSKPSQPAPAPAKPTAPSGSQPDSGPDINWGLILSIVGIVVACLLALAAIATVIYLVQKRVRATRRDASARRVALESKWTQARETLAEVRSEYNSYLLDAADRLFVRPLLDDPEELLTATFLTAYGDANAVDYETCPYDPDMISRSLSNAQRAATAWKVASSHAKRVGVGDLSPADRGRLRKARSLLDTALDPATTDELRTTILDKITDLLNSVDSPKQHKSPHEVVSDVIRHTPQLQAKADQLQLPA